MTATDLDALRALLIRHEGERLKPYRDTVGKLTIGVGRNLDDKGLTPDESRLLLENDIAEKTGAVFHLFPWAASLDAARQCALIDLAFMGPDKLLGFVNMMGALQRGDYDTAATELMNSKYAAQVGQRAKDIAAIFQRGTL